MKRYILRRIVQLIPVLVGITLVSFTLMYLSPSDPALMMLNAQGVAPTQELLDQTRQEMGLNQPFFSRYISWITSAMQGDFGYSYTYSSPVSTVIAQRFPTTFILSIASLIVVIVVAVPLGIAAALRKGGITSAIIHFFEFFSLSMPTFWLGLLLIYIFALTLGWLPAISNSTKAIGFILPVVALSFSYIGRLIGQVNVDVTEELDKPYIVGLRSRGIPRRQIIWHHVVRNALLPSITVVGLALGAMLSGSVTTEMVFSLQGLGYMSIQAITGRDYALVQGYVVITAFFFVMVNLAVDLIYHACDPQLRVGTRGGVR
ncbi:MAG: ABC transporter permease [Eggerthellaceae bacterium]|nr:ABC transporter permease [Eggerthellaceae bacterium]